MLRKIIEIMINKTIVSVIRIHLKTNPHGEQADSLMVVPFLN